MNYVFCIMEDVNDSIPDVELASAGHDAASRNGTGRAAAACAGGTDGALTSRRQPGILDRIVHVFHDTENIIHMTEGCRCTAGRS